MMRRSNSSSTVIMVLAGQSDPFAIGTAFTETHSQWAFIHPESVSLPVINAWLWLSVWALTLFTTPTPSLTQTLNGANNHAKYAKSFDKRSAGVKALFGPFSSVIGVPVYEFRPQNLLQNCVASLDVYFHQTRHLNVSPVLSFFFCLFANCSLCRRPLIFAVTIPVTTRPNRWQRLSGWLRLRHLVTLRLTV